MRLARAIAAVGVCVVLAMWVSHDIPDGSQSPEYTWFPTAAPRLTTAPSPRTVATTDLTQLTTRLRSRTRHLKHRIRTDVPARRRMRPATAELRLALTGAPARRTRRNSGHAITFVQAHPTGETTLAVDGRWQTDLERLWPHITDPRAVRLAADSAFGPALERTVTHALRWRLERVGECWQRSARAEAATATIHLSIDATGRVSRVALYTSSGLAELDRCLVSVLRRLSLPQPPGDAMTLALPLSFHRRS